MNNKTIVVMVAFFVGYFFVSLLLPSTNKKNKSQENNKANDNQHKKEDHKSQNSDLWYKILEVEEDASLQEIKKAYRKKILEYHPDRVASLGKEFQILAEEKAKKINNAYNEALRIKKI